MARLVHGCPADTFAGARSLDGVALPFVAHPDEVVRNPEDLLEARCQNGSFEQVQPDTAEVLLDDEAVQPGFVTGAGQTEAILRAGSRSAVR